MQNPMFTKIGTHGSQGHLRIHAKFHSFLILREVISEKSIGIMYSRHEKSALKTTVFTSLTFDNFGHFF